MDTKSCTKCGETKALTDFYRNAKRKDGLQYQCKVCQKSYAAAYYMTEASRDKVLLKLYGITAQRYDELNEAQGGKCGICGKVCVTGNRLAVDHDHGTGEVRGLLCLNCNQGLGKFFDDITLLSNAIEYLTG